MTPIAKPPTAPTQRYPLIRRLIPKRFHPLLRGLRKRLDGSRRGLPEPFYSVFPYTQASRSRQENLLRLAREIDRDGVPGAVVECGVLDGGTAALMAHGSSTTGRPVHLFDAWKGLPEITEKDGQASQSWVGDVVGSPRRVVKVMESLKIPTDRVHFHVGWFHETFPRVEIPQLALLHIDCDFYKPTTLCLEKWYPLLVPGGFIQFDDYSEFEGCYNAVNEFLAHHPELELEQYGTKGKAYYLAKPA